MTERVAMIEFVILGGDHEKMAAQNISGVWPSLEKTVKSFA